MNVILDRLLFVRFAIGLKICPRHWQGNLNCGGDCELHAHKYSSRRAVRGFTDQQRIV